MQLGKMSFLGVGTAQGCGRWAIKGALGPAFLPLSGCNDGWDNCMTERRDCAPSGSQP